MAIFSLIYRSRISIGNGTKITSKIFTEFEPAIRKAILIMESPKTLELFLNKRDKKGPRKIILAYSLTSASINAEFTPVSTVITTSRG